MSSIFHHFICYSLPFSNFPAFLIAYFLRVGCHFFFLLCAGVRISSWYGSIQWAQCTSFRWCMNNRQGKTRVLRGEPTQIIFLIPACSCAIIYPCSTLRQTWTPWAWTWRHLNFHTVSNSLPSTQHNNSEDLNLQYLNDWAYTDLLITVIYTLLTLWSIWSLYVPSAFTSQISTLCSQRAFICSMFFQIMVTFLVQR